MKGCYGAWINTDGFTVGEDREIHAGMRIFEAAKQLGTIQHYIYSGLDYVFKVRSLFPFVLITIIYYIDTYRLIL